MPQSNAARTASASIVVVIHMRTVNPLNRRENHFGRAGRVRKERLAVFGALRSRGVPMPPPLPVVVTLTRVSQRAMDSDGAIASLKSVRDEVARWLGVDDRDTADLVWMYGQDKGPMGVRIEIERRAA